jgi:tetratricopeptide (TPR) repeat protein
VLAAILPQFWLLFIPFGVGWVIIAFLASQSRVRREYQAAIKHLRKGEYDDAIRVMTDLISEEPQVADHYRFRAELFRLHGKLKRAQKDYQKVIELMPDSGVGYNGLAEVFLQDGDNAQALGFAQKAYAMERSYWVAPYNLGMIEERLGQLGTAVEHLREALKVGIPDSRHRLLVHLWLIRAQVGQNKLSEAEAELTALRNERPGLREWKTVFESEEAAVLKDVLEADIQQAEGLIEGKLSLSEVGDAHASQDDAR